MITPEILEVEPTGAFLLKHINGGRNLTFYDNKGNLPAGWTQHELVVLKPVGHEVVLELQKLLRDQEASHRAELSAYVNYPEYRDKNVMEKRIQALEKEVAFYRDCFEQMTDLPGSTSAELSKADYQRISVNALKGPPNENQN